MKPIRPLNRMMPRPLPEPFARQSNLTAQDHLSMSLGKIRRRLNGKQKQPKEQPA
jgi:hypothetical protein